MLILSRRSGEAFKIGEDITIVIHEIGGERVRVGIEAPKNISIVRSELLLVAQQNKEAAAAVSSKALKGIVGRF